jgi:hypothetical protein
MPQTVVYYNQKEGRKKPSTKKEVKSYEEQ